jgi:hypothetical protein
MMLIKILSAVMIVVGVGAMVFAFSDYTPGGAGDFAGWPLSCRYMMTAGAMLATGGRLLGA